jgi:phosphate transport system substrate-binding protein
MKRTIVIVLFLTTALFTFAGGSKDASAFDAQKSINVVSREDGSGTRGAFIEIFGIEERGADGSRKDMTTREAIIARATDVMMTNIAGDKYAIGYISLGSLNNTVKAVAVNGAAATTGNVKSGGYTIARPFFIAAKSGLSPLAQDFVGYILSAEGQAVIAKSYIPVNEAAAAYAGNRPSGKIVVAGSSSVTPIMEKLREAYLALNPSAAIEIQMSDSTAGMTAAMNGTCDIGMASRELKDSEKAQLVPTQIAIDGIAIIVNKDNPVADLAKEQINAIYTGKTTSWNAVIP